MTECFSTMVFLIEALTAERVDAAPSAAVPAAAALTRDCILQMDKAVVLAHDFPRNRRAHPRE
jgi:hypothetical protein